MNPTTRLSGCFSSIRRGLAWAGLPPAARNILRAILYGVAAGLAAVAFQQAINFAQTHVWEKLRACDPLTFAWASLLIIGGTSLLAGLLTAKVSPDAAGSGIPQLKLAFWRDFGYVPLRAVLVKFFGGVLAIGGGASLGREGPTVHIGGALCSNLAGWLGVARQGRRAATAAGAAAGLAAAFNTPLASITFVLEEIIEDLNNARYLVYTLIAAVLATFVTQVFIGSNPAFVIAPLAAVSYKIYLLVPLVAAAAAVGGMFFQKITLGWRARIRAKSNIPAWLRPCVGALVTWALGVTVFALWRNIGVFGLGYHALTELLNDGTLWHVALALFAAKLLATAGAYAWGGCGGIFAPTLFIGAAAAVGVTGALEWLTPLALGRDEHILLAVLGMSAGLGAVVRAPITSILIVFEMTREFKFVPALMLGAVVSQAVSRLLAKNNFYNAALAADGHDLKKIIPPRTLDDWQRFEVGSIANFKPVTIGAGDLTREKLRPLLAAHPYRFFPVVRDGQCTALLDRRAAWDFLAASGDTVPTLPPPPALAPETPVTRARAALVASAECLLVLTNSAGQLVGLLTLHDLLRAEMKAQEARQD